MHEDHRLLEHRARRAQSRRITLLRNEKTCIRLATPFEHRNSVADVLSTMECSIQCGAKTETSEEFDWAWRRHRCTRRSGIGKDRGRGLILYRMASATASLRMGLAVGKCPRTATTAEPSPACRARRRECRPPVSPGD